MKDTLYLVFTEKGMKTALKTRPVMNAGEYVVAVSLEVPNEFFKPAPIPEISIQLPDNVRIATKALETFSKVTVYTSEAEIQQADTSESVDEKMVNAMNMANQAAKVLSK